MGVERIMATKLIKAWIDGAIQEIEVEDIVSPEQPLSYEDRLNELEDKPIITDGNLLVGNDIGLNYNVLATLVDIFCNNAPVFVVEIQQHLA